MEKHAYYLLSMQPDRQRSAKNRDNDEGRPLSIVDKNIVSVYIRNTEIPTLKSMPRARIFITNIHEQY